MDRKGTGSAAAGGATPGARRIGMALADRQADAPLADQLAASHWILIHEGPFLAMVVHYDARSEASVVEAFRSVDATDVVALRLDPEACRSLQEAGIEVWEGEPGVPGNVLAERVLRGTLPRYPAPVRFG